MKKRIPAMTMIVMTACVGCLVFAVTAAEMDKPMGKDIIMTGHLSCTFCKLAHPDMTCKPDCCTACMKAGDPPLLTDSAGEMYLLITGEKEVPLMTAERMKMVGGKVTVKGLYVKGKGIQAIYVNSMEKAEQ